MNIKADLHLHSMYSEHPTDWFLQRLGAAESYSRPKKIYKLAKSRGMGFVTITDHNKIDGIVRLMAKHPDDTFMGVESTAYFPEDGCKVHILIYGFKEKNFPKIEKYRKNIYKLRDYIKKKGFAYSVAHANYSVNNKLQLEHIEKLILLFDVFEGINGGRGRNNNKAVFDVLSNLTPRHIDRLFKKHGIDPFSDTPWKKGFTAGSDDHAGLYIGQTYTTAEADTPADFLKQLKSHNTEISGRHNDYTSLTFMVYKIAWDYSETKSKKIAKNLIKNINDMIFESKPLSFINWMKIKGYGATAAEDDIMAKKIVELVDKLRKVKEPELEERFAVVHGTIAGMVDEILGSLIKYVTENISDINITNLFSRVSSILPTIFLSAPFVTALNHLYKDRGLVRELRTSFGLAENSGKSKKILWFTDTINDVNGVSVTLKEVSWHAYKNGRDIRIATSLNETDDPDILPPNSMIFPRAFAFTAPYYEKLRLRLPSVLNALKMIHEYDPDEIYISTPGFIGLLGMAAARLMHIPAISIFHTDFVAQIDRITQDESFKNLSKTYIKWFYNNSDIVATPTKEYKGIIKEMGVKNKDIKFFKRWIDTGLFKPGISKRDELIERFGLPNGPVLLFTGRISRDKNIDLAADAFKEIQSRRGDMSLLILGEGPYLEEMREKYADRPNIFFPGTIDRKLLPEVYSAADIFVFPSETDTFGMSVLEAQSCGLPCLVSDVGGPQEIIINGITGFVLKSNLGEWTSKIEELLNMMDSDPISFNELKNYSRRNASARFDWDEIINKNLIRDFDEITKTLEGEMAESQA